MIEKTEIESDVMENRDMGGFDDCVIEDVEVKEAPEAKALKPVEQVEAECIEADEEDEKSPDKPSKRSKSNSKDKSGDQEQKSETDKAFESLVRAITENMLTEKAGEIVDRLNKIQDSVKSKSMEMAESAKEAIKQAVAEAVQPKTIKIEHKEVVNEIDGKQHVKFQRLLELCAFRFNGRAPNIFIVGPAGCGKSYAVKQVAEALGVEFDFINLSAGISESRFVGKYVPTGANGAHEYLPAQFVTMFNKGGIYCLDEIDAADENVLMCLSGALSLGLVSLPDGRTVERHKDFVCVACANTMGTGADRIYVGRNQLDGATIDRFRAWYIEFEYDKRFEKSIGNKELVEWSHITREKIDKHKIRKILSTRFIIETSAAMEGGIYTLDEVKALFFIDWSDSELRTFGQ